MDIVKKLELYRLENKVTQEELAEELGVAFSTVNRWFNGWNVPGKIQQYHIEKFLTLRQRSGLIPSKVEGLNKKAKKK